MNWPTLPETVNFSLVCLSSVFFTVDPLGAIPAFLFMGARGNDSQNRLVARHASWTAFWVLAAFSCAGSLIFKLFGITLPAFKIAGGVLLFLLALEMMQAHRSRTQETEGERIDGETKRDFGVIPLGIPMLAGPGAVSTVMVLMGQTKLWWQTIPVFGAIAITALSSYYTLAFASQIERVLGETGIRILMRLMGLTLSAVAVQFVLNGVSDIWPGGAGAHR